MLASPMQVIGYRFGGHLFTQNTQQGETKILAYADQPHLLERPQTIVPQS